MNKYILTKEEFLEMYNPDVLRRVYDNTMDKIEDRFHEVTKHLFGFFGGNSPNVCYVVSKWCSEDDPYFDFDEYAEYIEISMDLHAGWYENDKSLKRKIPTRWLWEETYLTEYNTIVNAIKRRSLKKELENYSMKNWKKLQDWKL